MAGLGIQTYQAFARVQEDGFRRVFMRKWLAELDGADRSETSERVSS